MARAAAVQRNDSRANGTNAKAVEAGNPPPRVARPDLVVYLQARTEVLLQRIKKRGRDYERNIEPAYLDALAKAYRDFFFHYEDTPLLVVNTSDIDFEANPEDLETLVSVIARHRKGTRHYVPLGTRAG